MTEVVRTARPPLARWSRRATLASGVALIAPIAWRNLARNPRRTWLTAGSIGFAVALLAFAMAQQRGQYATMIDNATALLTGHLQIHRRGFQEDPRIETTVTGASAIRRVAENFVGVQAVTERVQAFVLVSAGERSFAGLLMGVAPAGEVAISNLPKMVVDGRYLDANPEASTDGAVEAFAGDALARNLGVAVGDEIVVLGTDAQGGVAALVVRLVGTFSSGQQEIDRAMLQVPIAPFRSAFSLGDEAHSLVVRSENASQSTAVANALRGVLTEPAVVLEWPDLIPELEQMIELDRNFGLLLFGVLAVLVTFSVVATFIMLVFERTHEFGMLLAVGMRPRGIIGMLLQEAFWLALLGVAGGLVVAIPAIAWSARVGIPLGETGDLLARFHMPGRMHAAFESAALVQPALLMLIATVVAALVPALRVRKLRPAEALRAP